MVVALITSNTLDGLQFNDALDGGGVGIDYGSVGANSYTPVDSKAANTGRKDIYISHDAVTDPITELSVNIQQYGVGTGFAYNGSQTALIDFNDLKAMGLGSGFSRNNADGNSAGVWLEMESNVSNALQFDRSLRPTLVKVFGEDNGGGAEGVTLSGSFKIKKEAMVYEDSGEIVAAAPVDGFLGKAGDTNLGDSAHIRQRVYIPASFLKSGIFQYEQVFNYAFTG